MLHHVVGCLTDGRQGQRDTTDHGGSKRWRALKRCTRQVFHGRPPRVGSRHAAARRRVVPRGSIVDEGPCGHAMLEVESSHDWSRGIPDSGCRFPHGGGFRAKALSISRDETGPGSGVVLAEGSGDHDGCGVLVSGSRSTTRFRRCRCAARVGGGAWFSRRRLSSRWWCWLGARAVGHVRVWWPARSVRLWWWPCAYGLPIPTQRGRVRAGGRRPASECTPMPLGVVRR